MIVSEVKKMKRYSEISTGVSVSEADNDLLGRERPNIRHELRMIEMSRQLYGDCEALRKQERYLRGEF